MSLSWEKTKQGTGQHLDFVLVEWDTPFLLRFNQSKASRALRNVFADGTLSRSGTLLRLGKTNGAFQRRNAPRRVFSKEFLALKFFAEFAHGFS